jgi:hypothetical protein
MRIGFNPNKDKKIEPSDFFHQVIIPVHIPNFEGYFKDSFQILQYCLKSLFKTSHAKTFFSVVNNGSCTEVTAYLNQLLESGKIQEVIHTSSIGKLNAILKGMSGQNFPLITMTDADVLFLNGWQEASYDVFKTFPKAGVVSTTPNSKMLRYYTSNILFETFFSKRIKFTEVVDSLAMVKFADSIGNSTLFKPVHLEKYLTISKDNFKAVVGSGHFVATYRSDVFNKSITNYSEYKMGSALSGFFDNAALKKDMWRLSTEQNYTFHMGNTKEAWMGEMIEKSSKNNNIITLFKLKDVKSNKFIVWFKSSVFSRVIFRNPFWQFYLGLKGLTSEETNEY